MFKSDSEVESLISHPNNVIHKTIGTGNHGKGGVKEGSVQSPPNEESRARIAILATILGDKTAAEMTGVDRSYATKFRNGQKLDSSPDQSLEKELISRRGTIQSKALEKAELFLDMIGVNSDLNDDVKRSNIADRVVSIFERLAPKTPTINAENAQIVFYAPKIKESTEYPVIDVEAQAG
jgi:hypothetical protein